MGACGRKVSVVESGGESGLASDMGSVEESGGGGLMKNVDRDGVLESGLCGGLYRGFPGCCLHCVSGCAPYEASDGGFGADGHLFPCHPSSLTA